MQSARKLRNRDDVKETPLEKTPFYGHWFRVYVTVIITTLAIFVLLWIFSDLFTP